MGYVNEFANKAQEYKVQSDKGTREEAKEEREKIALTMAFLLLIYYLCASSRYGVFNYRLDEGYTLTHQRAMPTI